jgi:hypothetical protein
MLSPRNLAIATAGALAVIPVSKAQACDNDRFPCPIISGAPSQGSAEAVSAAPAQPSKKKPTQAAQKGGKPASAKSEGDTAQAPARPKPNKPTGQDQANRTAKPSNPAAHEPANAAGAPSPQAIQVASPVPVPPEQPYSAATVRTDSAPALTPGLAPASTEADTPGTPTLNPQQVAAAGDFKLAERNEVAAAPPPIPAGWSWKPYVLVLLGGALAAAMMVRWLLRTTRGARPGLVPDGDASGASPV